MENHISLAQIAKKSKFSIATVSLALHDDRRIKDATRAKIQRVAQALGYRPHPLLASLAGRRFRSARRMKYATLAFLTQDGPNVGQEDVNYAASKEHAANLGYSIDRYSLAALEKMSNPSQLLYQRGTAGLILSNFFRIESSPHLDFDLFSTVALGTEADMETRFFNPSLHRVSYDHFYAVQRCWTEAQKAGYKRIGIVLMEHPTAVSDDLVRQASALVCVNRVKPRFRVPLFRAQFTNIKWTDIKTWLDRHEPDVVIGFNNLVLHLIQQAGRRVPRDVAFISLHTGTAYREAGLEYVGGTLTQAAIDFLDQQIRQHHRGIPKASKTLLIPQSWVDGPTLPRVSLAS